jgi:RNA polymerase sigma-70 factor (ECF subfamily)
VVNEALYAAWRDRLLRFCGRLLRNRHDAEEVVQDVFAKLLAHDGRYTLDGDPGVLLFQLARHRCIDVRRKHAPEARAEVAAVASAPSEPHAEIAEALALLPFEEREVLLLTAVDGLGYREVAAILGCSLGTVAARKYAAVEKLKRRLAP